MRESSGGGSGSARAAPLGALTHIRLLLAAGKGDGRVRENVGRDTAADGRRKEGLEEAEEPALEVDDVEKRSLLGRRRGAEDAARARLRVEGLQPRLELLLANGLEAERDERRTVLAKMRAGLKGGRLGAPELAHRKIGEGLGLARRLERRCRSKPLLRTQRGGMGGSSSPANAVSIAVSVDKSLHAFISSRDSGDGIHRRLKSVSSAGELSTA